MKTSRQLLDAAGIVPKLRLGIRTDKGVVSTGHHRVRLLDDKEIDGTDNKGKPCKYIQYIVEENGEKKQYQTKKLNDKGELNYLVQRLAEEQEGNEVILELRKAGIKNYVSVSSITNSSTAEVDEYPDDPEGLDSIQI